MTTARSEARSSGRCVHAALDFARGGGRTFLARQFVPYPFHVTRPHALHADCPEMATLILQSASGGLYRGDQLRLDVSAGPGARAHLATQAATVVHAATGGAIVVDLRLRAGPGAFLAVTVDPNILFPGTALTARTTVTLAPDATAILAEGFATHDPAEAGRFFARLATACRVQRSDGTTLVDEAGALDGAAFAGLQPPLGPFRAVGTVMLLGEAAAGLPAAPLVGALDKTEALGGATALPNGAGMCVRLLARGGGPLARGLDAVWAAGFAALTGHAPAPRRR